VLLFQNNGSDKLLNTGNQYLLSILNLVLRTFLFLRYEYF